MPRRANRPGIPHGDIMAAARAVAADPPSLVEWERRRDRVVPLIARAGLLRSLGWPTDHVDATVPDSTSDGRPARQPLAVVPGSWLRALAELLHVEWTAACKFELPDEPRGVGRPSTIPADARNRTIRLTDAEYEAVMRFRDELRAAK